MMDTPTAKPTRRRAGLLAWTLRALGLLLAVALLGAALVFIEVSLTWTRHRPIVAALADSAPATTAYMERRSRQGKPPRLRRWIALDSLPPVVVCAVVASENANFFQPGALDWYNQRLLLERILRGDLSRGGSGIAQQLARNLFLAPDRTARRKLREYVLAFQLARLLTKERQLELYLNLIEWGDGVWGVAAASVSLFGKPVAELTPSEAVLMANVLPAPSRGLAFPLSPPRREKLGRVATLLWRATVIDDLSWSATTARLRRTGEHLDQGDSPADALAATAEEMGPDRLADPPLAPASDWAARCDAKRRGVP